MENTQLSLFGKMCPELSAATKVRISAASSKSSPKSARGGVQFLDLLAGSGIMQERSWETDSPLHGGCATLNIGECPSAVKESTLWQILQADAPEKYYLSAKACAGILRRAERRGKTLPKMLREALEETVLLGARCALNLGRVQKHGR